MTADELPTLPEVNCLEEQPHAAHPWESVSHRWACPGRSIPAAFRAAGQLDPMIDREARSLPAPDGRVVDRLQAADRAPVSTVPQFFMLDRTDVHQLALRLIDDAATIAELSAELERVISR